MAASALTRSLAAMIGLAAACFAGAEVARADEPVRPITRVMPVYPDEAWNQEINGSVRAELIVDDRGRVKEVRILSEEPLGHGFGAAAIDAFTRWRYPQKAAGAYKAKFTFKYEPLPLEADEEGLPSSTFPPTKREKPTYPDEAVDIGMEGDVICMLLIEPSGDVARARVVDDTAPGFGFAEAATVALKAYKFAPATTRSIYRMTVKFRMADSRGSHDEAVSVDRSTYKPAPEPTRSETPEYPAKAKAAGIGGTVEIGVSIVNGKVKYAGVLSETPEGYGFGGAAYKSVIGWRFNTAEPGNYIVRVDFKPDTADGSK